MLAPAAVVAVAAVALLVQPEKHRLAAGEGNLEVHGSVLLRHDGGATVTLHGGTARVKSGDTIEVRSGTARLMTSDAVIDARAGTAGVAGTALKMATTPQLVAGEALLTSSDGASLESSKTRVTAGSLGAPSTVRVALTLAVGVGVYQGSADVDSAGNRMHVGRLRYIEVAALGQLPAAPGAIGVHPSDPWDRKYLEPAIAIDQEVDPLARAFDQSSPPVITPAALHVADLPAPDQVQQLIDRAHLVDGALTDPSDAIIGASIATLGSEGPFDTRWMQVFSFHADRASWGLVAMDQGVDPGALLTRIQAAVNSTTGLAFDTPGQAAGVGSPPVISGGSSPGGSASPGGSNAPGGSSPSGGNSQPTPTPPTAPTLPSVPRPPVTRPPVTVPQPVPGLPPGALDGATALLSGLLNSIPGR